MFGLRFDEKLSPVDIRNCGGVQVDAATPRYGFCFLGGSHRLILLSGFPVAVFESGSVVLDDDDMPEALLLNGKHDDYPEIRRLLVERYGQPTTSAPGTASNRMGATFSNETVIWLGKLLVLTLQERAGQVDRTTAVFQYMPRAAKQIKQRDEQRKTDASKM